MTRGRIALVHFTAPPVVGGVEALLAAQAEVLHGSGVEVTVITGEGDPAAAYRLAVIPELHPHHPEVRASKGSEVTDADHPLVQRISAALLPIFKDQDQIWVHNAFTVYLNPFLTVALQRLYEQHGVTRWVTFCHDLSATSRYWHGPSPPHGIPGGSERVDLRYAVLSPSRRTELASLLGVAEDAISVIPPPLDVVSWLGVGAEARHIAAQTHLFERDVTFLVPAKLLPHKRIDLAIRILAQLKGQGLNPMGLVTGAPSAHEPLVSARLMKELRAQARRDRVEECLCFVTSALGHIAEPETVRDLMSLCDLVFLPSAEEGYGTPINEAIALRAPLLCADSPSFRYAGEGYARYVDSDDVVALAEQMLAIATGPAGTRRREVMRSLAAFRTAILEVAGY